MLLRRRWSSNPKLTYSKVGGCCSIGDGAVTLLLSDAVGVLLIGDGAKLTYSKVGGCCSIGDGAVALLLSDAVGVLLIGEHHSS